MIENQVVTDKLICSKIIETIVFFDLFDYPLTSEEIWQYLYYKEPVSRRRIEELLVRNILKPAINHQAGFYFLNGRSSLIETRQKRYEFASAKFRRAQKIAKVFKFIPWIRLIAVSNLIGSYNLRHGSDIDLFIVTDPKRIWVTRFFTVIVIKLLGLRPKPGRTQDTICLSFFITEEDLSLKKFLLNDDIYFVYWLAGLEPIYDTDSTFDNLYKVNNWLHEYLPNWPGEKGKGEFMAGRPWSNTYYNIVDFLLGWTDQWFKKLQFKLLAPGLKKEMNLDTRVVINDQVLKLHSNDRRSEFNQSHLVRIKQYE